jgi:hypothetical protein
MEEKEVAEVVRISAEDLLALLEEIKLLRTRVRELQRSCTEYCLEVRTLKGITE